MSLSFEAPREPGMPHLDLSQYENRKRVALLSDREHQNRGGLSVTHDSHAVEGTRRLSVGGSFKGTLGPSETYGRDIDLSNAVPVSGNFTVTLEALD